MFLITQISIGNKNLTEFNSIKYITVFNSMVYRIVNIPLDKKNLEQKLKLMIKIPKFNVYEKDLTLKMIRKQIWSKEHRIVSTFNNG